MRRFIREPLLHFVLLGAALFAIDGLWNERSARASDDEIVVSRGRIENLAALFTKTWQRPPSDDELRHIVDDFVMEEALYREGMALGVDQNDTVIRRRVRQKMEFVVDDIIEQAEPTEADLEMWLADHPDSYSLPGRFHFRQVYLNPKQRGDADAAQVLAELRALEDGADPREFGDPSLLPHAFADEDAQSVSSTFGVAFAEGLADQPTGEWSGPLRSAYGLHLIYIDRQSEGDLRPLDEVREAVRRDWSFAQREAAQERFYEGILERYSVVIEWVTEAGMPTESGSDASGLKSARQP